VGVQQDQCRNSADDVQTSALEAGSLAADRGTVTDSLPVVELDSDMVKADAVE